MSNVANLTELVRPLDSLARVVPVLPLRRAIRIARGLDDLSLRAPHEQCWRVSREELLRSITLVELGLPVNDQSPEFLLIAEPREEEGHDVRRILWRVMFHAAADRAVEQWMTREPTVPLQWRRVLGPSTWGEIREVLEGVNLIGEEDPDRVLFREFVAFHFELQFFEPDHIADYFPGLRASDTQRLEQLARDLQLSRLLDNMRPSGVPTDPSHVPVAPIRTPGQFSNREDPPDARQACERGNDVLAAILYRRAGSSRAAERIELLQSRLQKALGAEFDREILLDLLELAYPGGWPPERRALYELQRACLDFEKQTFAVSVAETVLSFGRRPLKRPLTKTQFVSALLHLRKAHRLIENSRLPEDQLHRFLEQLHHLMRQIEKQARDQLRPELVRTLDEVGLQPRSRAEQFSRDKTIEELLDLACAKGFLRIGDLRDAIARCRVKLDNLQGPLELIRGDALLRANKLLPERLDGVYHRGEVYMRALQRGCSLFFGTRPGQLFTLYLAVPFLGAYLFLEAIYHMAEAVVGLWHFLTGWSTTTKGIGLLGGGPAMVFAENPEFKHHGITWHWIVAVGIFFFLLMHWTAFRQQMLHLAKFLFIKIPKAIARSEIVRWLYHNPILTAVRRFLLIPLVLAALAGLIVKLNFGTEAGLYTAVAVFALAFLALRTAYGRSLEDQVNEAVGRLWKVISVNFALGILAWMIDLFKTIFGLIEASIYTVDEWLRFREGESQISFVLKLGFGMIWGCFTYLFRLMWNLFVEPQINPIKHFPVVTVSHKLLLPMIPSLSKQLAIDEKTVTTVVFAIPGIFGFLAWELKENWKLYRRNASGKIGATVVGSHGESFRMLMRPGFHSGVVPKTYVKLRKALSQGKIAKAAKHRHHLHHCAEALDRLAERTFVHVLQLSRRWAGRGIQALPVHFGTNRARFAFAIDGLPRPVCIDVEQRGGWIIASLSDSDLSGLSVEQQATFVDVLTGFYKLLGVHVVREHLSAQLGSEAYGFDATPEGLLIEEAGKTTFYDYNDGPELIAPERHLNSATILFSETPLPWNTWQERWQNETDTPALSGSQVLYQAK